MQAIYQPKQYPPQVLAKLRLMPPLAVEIANRWALGWPETVAELVQAGIYLEALTNQEQQEREALTQPGMNHLARHEIVQEMALSLAPPAVNPTT